MPQDVRITVDELRKRMEAGEDFTIIDARNPQAWSESSEKLPDALRIPVDAFEQNISRIPRDKPVVVYCT
jgi:rhodanese-related sulfurtransferase